MLYGARSNHLRGRREHSCDRMCGVAWPTASASPAASAASAAPVTRTVEHQVKNSERRILEILIAKLAGSDDSSPQL